MSEQNTLEENKALIRRWFEEVWNKGRSDAIAEMMAPDAVAHGLSDDAAKPLRGPQGFLPFHTQFREAFPNIEVVVEDTIAEGDRVVARCSVTGMSPTAWDSRPPALKPSSTASPSSESKTARLSKPGTTLIL
jgi:predicted ester cyclase